MVMLDRFKVKVGGADQSWLEVFEEACVLLYREIDYQCEADNMRRFKSAWDARKWAKVPAVYDALSTSKILVMEYVPGIKVRFAGVRLVRFVRCPGVATHPTPFPNPPHQISDTAAIDADPALDRRKLAERLAEAYLLQFCVDRFFHTDPHPGNLVVDGGAPGGRIIFYDFGQASGISAEKAGGILRVIKAIVDFDARACVAAFDELGILAPGADRIAVQRTVRRNFETGKVTSRASRDKQAGRARAAAGPGEALGDDAGKLTSTTEAEKLDASLFVIPSVFAFVARALTQLEGVGKTLDADYEFVTLVAPKVVEVEGSGNYLKGELAKLGLSRGGLERWAGQPDAVAQIRATLDALEAGDLRLRVRALDTEAALKRLEGKSDASMGFLISLVLAQTSVLGRLAGAGALAVRAPMVLGAAVGVATVLKMKGRAMAG